MTLDAELARGLDALHLPLAPGIETTLLDYVALIEKWNRVYNLTAVRDRDKMLTHHVLDSLSVLPHITGEHILDVGSGAGLPGIPLALALPRSHVTLLESSHKKSAFLRQATIELGLGNVEIVNARCESWDPPRLFDVVISRAFSDLAEFVALAGRHSAANGVLAAMKGVYPHDELARLPPGYRLNEAIALCVPGLDAERHLVLVGRS